VSVAELEKGGGGGVQRTHTSGDRFSDSGESCGGFCLQAFNSSWYLWGGFILLS